MGQEMRDKEAIAALRVCCSRFGRARICGVRPGFDAGAHLEGG